MNDKKPFEIARETLRQLSTRKLAPTPANYQAIYSEVAGISIESPFPLERLRDIALALPTKTPGQQKQRGLLESAIGQLNWAGVKTALMAYGGFSPPASEPVETRIAPAPLEPRAQEGAPAVNVAALTPDFLRQIARLIEYTLPALDSDDDRFAEQTRTLLQALREPQPDVIAAKLLLGNFGQRLSFVAEDQAEIKTALFKLLHLIIKNIGELSVEDHRLQGQIEALLAASTPPLTLRRLDEVERLLKDLIFKQTEVKGRALEAQEDMRQMLATFVERLSQMTESSSAYHSQIEEGARLIEQAKTLAEIAPVLKGVVGATRTMAQDSLIARDDLRGLREKAQATEAEIAKLHQELDRVGAQARHDPLTGVLNRKGLDETLAREMSIVQRQGRPLCLALLDIDDFKKLNDKLGHAAGDEALTHLAGVAREVMRPQDTLARYGAEEFVILLPDTALEAGMDAMTRLQRELSSRLFLTGTEKILMTFSAGVAQLGDDETGLQAIRRADQAMYLAKRSGKNRVLGA